MTFIFYLALNNKNFTCARLDLLFSLFSLICEIQSDQVGLFLS